MKTDIARERCVRYSAAIALARVQDALDNSITEVDLLRTLDLLQHRPPDQSWHEICDSELRPFLFDKFPYRLLCNFLADAVLQLLQSVSSDTHNLGGSYKLIVRRVQRILTTVRQPLRVVKRTTLDVLLHSSSDSINTPCDRNRFDVLSIRFSALQQSQVSQDTRSLEMLNKVKLPGMARHGSSAVYDVVELGVVFEYVVKSARCSEVRHGRRFDLCLVPLRVEGEQDFDGRWRSHCGDDGMILLQELIDHG